MSTVQKSIWELLVWGDTHAMCHASVVDFASYYVCKQR